MPAVVQLSELVGVRSRSVVAMATNLGNPNLRQCVHPFA